MRQLETVKEEFRRIADRLPENASTYLHELPATPVELMKSHPKLYDIAYSAHTDEERPCRCPIDMIRVRELNASFMCRGTGSRRSSSTSTEMTARLGGNADNMVQVMQHFGTQMLGMMNSMQQTQHSALNSIMRGGGAFPDRTTSSKGELGDLVELVYPPHGAGRHGAGSVAASDRKALTETPTSRPDGGTSTRDDGIPPPETSPAKETAIVSAADDPKAKPRKLKEHVGQIFAMMDLRKKVAKDASLAKKSEDKKANGKKKKKERKRHRRL